VQVRYLDREFGALDLTPVHGFANLAESPFGGAARPANLFQALGARSRCLELFAVRGVHGLLGGADIVRRVGHERGEALENAQVEFEGLTSARRLEALGRSALQALLDLAPALLDQTTPLAKLGLAARQHRRQLDHVATSRFQGGAVLVHVTLALIGVTDGALEPGKFLVQRRQLLVERDDLRGEPGHFAGQRCNTEIELFDQLAEARDLALQTIQFSFGLGVQRARTVEALASGDGRLVSLAATFTNGTDRALGLARRALGLLDR
jgi:hypothetical protein